VNHRRIHEALSTPSELEVVLFGDSASIQAPPSGSSVVALPVGKLSHVVPPVPAGLPACDGVKIKSNLTTVSMLGEPM
jgi:hypothetical protein